MFFSQAGPCLSDLPWATAAVADCSEADNDLSRHQTRFKMWEAVKMMVPAVVPILVRPLVTWMPKTGTAILTTFHKGLGCWDLAICFAHERRSAKSKGRLGLDLEQHLYLPSYCIDPA